MAVLQGMRNIIAKNWELSIFTEFSPEALITAGYLSAEYLKKICNYGFGIYLIDEKKQSLEPVEFDHLMKACESTGYVNLLCQRGQRIML